MRTIKQLRSAARLLLLLGMSGRGKCVVCSRRRLWIILLVYWLWLKSMSSPVCIKHQVITSNAKITSVGSPIIICNLASHFPIHFSCSMPLPVDKEINLNIICSAPHHLIILHFLELLRRKIDWESTGKGAKEIPYDHFNKIDLVIVFCGGWLAGYPCNQQSWRATTTAEAGQALEKIAPGEINGCEDLFSAYRDIIIA